MRIKSVRIDRYGPLGEVAEQSLGDFNLIYGANERGKTLMIDAILKLLFKKELNRTAKSLGNIGRVSEQPEGFLVLRADGADIKLEKSDTLSKLFGISATDFRNVFVVRDSDLRIEDEREYYAQVSEKLSGLRTSEIENIKKALQRSGRLTNPSSKGELSDSAPADHIGGRVKRAEKHIELVENRLTFLRNSDYDHLERALGETKERIGILEGELRLQKQAKVTEQYREADRSYRTLQSVANELSQLAPFNDDDAYRWADHETDIRRIRHDLQLAEKQRLEKQDKLDAARHLDAKRRACIDELSQSCQRFDDILAPKIEICEDLRKKRAQGRSSDGFWKWGMWTLTVLLALSLVGNVIAASPFSIIFSAVFLVLLVLSAWRWLAAKKRESELAEALKDVGRAARRFDVTVDTFDDLAAIRNPYEADLENERRLVGQLDIEKRMLVSEQSELSRKIDALNERIRDAEEAVSTLKTQSGVDGVDAYRSRLKLKGMKHAEQQTLRALLGRLMPGSGENKMQRWKAEIARRLAPASVGQVPVAYDRDRAAAIEKNLTDMRTKLGEIDEALNMGREQLHDLEVDIARSEVFPDTKVECRTTRDLENLAQMLRSFVDRTRIQKENALHALRIFEDIESEERSRVEELFGGENPVARYFADMTGGEYDAVRFDVPTSGIHVRHRHGQWLSSDQLSGGAFDQLYLATRLSLAQSMLGDDRGFFILDDPFIKADIGRLKRLVKLLQRLSKSGWQILYFSAKKEVLDALRPAVVAQQVNLVDLDAAPVAAPDRPRAAQATQPPIDLFSDSAAGD